MNQVTLEGNLVRDPDVFTSKTGNKIGKIRIACTTKDSSGKEETLYIDAKLFGSVYNDITSGDLKKGNRVVVVGKLATEEWKDKEENLRKDFLIYATRVLKLEQRKRLGNVESREEGNYSF